MTAQDLLDALYNLRGKIAPDQPIKGSTLEMIFEEAKRIEEERDSWQIKAEEEY